MIRIATLAAAAAALATLMLAPAASAHEAAKGANGGWRVDAGAYHTEVVADGTTSVIVYLSDANDKPLPAAGFKGTAILVINGKTQKFALQPADGSKLVGTAPAPVNSGVKGAIQITAPDGTTAQGKL
jgi:hypothetical protein